MRPIKFRIWDKQKKEFFTIPNSIVMFIGTADKFLAFATNQGLYTIPDTKQKDLGLDRWVLQQFTGLQDLNDKDIYEGDIVETIYSDWVGRIEYDVQLGAYRINNLARKSLPMTTVRFLNGEVDGLLKVVTKVIGNIYENSELLK